MMTYIPLDPFIDGLRQTADFLNDTVFSDDIAAMRDALELGRNNLRGAADKLGEVAGNYEKVVHQLEVKVPKWISVKERLPERHGQQCVCLYNQHGADKTLLFPFVFTWHAYGDNGYVNGPHFSDEGLDGLKVWYWMPLPETPKEE